MEVWEFFTIFALNLNKSNDMKNYKEKRKKGLAIRTCINCGEQWYVREKTDKEYKTCQKFCPKCLSTLSKEEKQHIWRIKVGGYHEEIRECFNCGKIWTVEVKDSCPPEKIKHFCEDCNKILSRSDRKRIFREKREGYHEKEKLLRKNSYKRNHIHAMIANARDRAIKYGYEFDIQDSDIIVPEVCPLLEVPFVLGEGKEYEYTPTIDRIDNTKGYTKDNIWVISKKANSMKNSATFKELETFCTNILRYSLNNREDESIELEDKEPLG